VPFGGSSRLPGRSFRRQRCCASRFAREALGQIRSAQWQAVEHHTIPPTLLALWWTVPVGDAMASA